MKVIIAGSRDIHDIRIIERAVAKSGFAITEAVSGSARGVDQSGEFWAASKNIPIKTFPAYWATYGRKAGPLRNEEMAEYADALIAIWDGNSKGTRDMIDRARKHNLKVYVETVSNTRCRS